MPEAGLRQVRRSWGSLPPRMHDQALHHQARTYTVNKFGGGYKGVTLCDENRSAPGVGTALSLLVVALIKQE